MNLWDPIPVGEQVRQPVVYTNCVSRRQALPAHWTKQLADLYNTELQIHRTYVANISDQSTDQTTTYKTDHDRRCGCHIDIDTLLAGNLLAVCCSSCLWPQGCRLLLLVWDSATPNRGLTTDYRPRCWTGSPYWRGTDPSGNYNQSTVSMLDKRWLEPQE